MLETIALAKKVTAAEEGLVIETEEGAYRVDWASCSRRLATANSLERNTFELAPSGYGIHWPLIDEDLTVGPLLARASKL